MRAKTFGALRRLVHAQSCLGIGRRMKRGPLRPTICDITLGVFIEDLELQVADAVMEMNRKGYSTWSSGFHAGKPCLQIIDGPFTLAASVIASLKELGVKVRTEKLFGRNYTDITFRSKIPDTRRIKQEWAKVVSRIPAKGYPAVLPDNFSSFAFHEQSPAMFRKASILRLQRRIGAYPYSRWVRRWRRQLRRLRTAR